LLVGCVETTVRDVDVGGSRLMPVVGAFDSPVVTGVREALADDGGVIDVDDGGTDVGGGTGLVDGPDGLDPPSRVPTTVVTAFAVWPTVVSRSETVVFTVLPRPSSRAARRLVELPLEVALAFVVAVGDGDGVPPADFAEAAPAKNVTASARIAQHSAPTAITRRNGVGAERTATAPPC